MPISRKAVGWLLLLSLTAAPMAAQVMSEVPAPHQQPAGCHEHQDRNQAPQPTNYACCKVGHRVALVPECFTQRSSWLPDSRVIASGSRTPVSSLTENARWQLIPGGSPPTLLALRI